MDLIIKINLDNASFEEPVFQDEIEYCLERIIELIKDGEEDGRVMDSLGNFVGQWRFK
jgi:hypothetical protein